MFQFKKYNIRNYDIWMILIVMLLSGIGVFLIRLVEKEGEGLSTKQIAGVILGLIIIIIVSLIDYHFISQFYIVLYIINLILLIAVRVAGTTINNSTRWLNLKIFMFQPSELTKIILIIFLAQLLVMFKDKMNKFYVLLIMGILIAVPTFLILIQTNLSTSLVIMFVFAMMIFARRLKLQNYFAGLVNWNSTDIWDSMVRWRGYDVFS